MNITKEKAISVTKYILIALFLYVVIFYIQHPAIIKYAFLLFPLFFYLLIRYSIHKKNLQPDEYFIYEREMPVKQFIPSYVTTNIGLFSSIGYSVILCCYYGFQGMLWTTLAWFLGMFWFSKKVKHLLPFLKKGHTLHEYIAIKYGKTDVQRSIIRGYTSIITFILYICSIGIEIKFSGEVLTPIFGLHESLIIALVISIVGVYCTYLSGYKGVVLTERLQYWIMVAMVGVILLFSFWTLIKTPTLNLSKDFWYGNHNKTFDISAMSILLLVYQFCVMDMWQRCIAIANSSAHKGKEDSEIIKALRESTFKKAILPFLIFFIAFFSIGLVCLAKGINDNYLASYLGLLADNSYLQLIMKSIIIVGFTAAAVSTVDSFLIAAVQTFMYDIYGNLLFKNLSTNINALDLNQQYRFTNVAKAYVLIFGLCAILLALFSFDFIQFWTSMYSIMLGFFPAVYFSLIKKNSDHKYSLVLAGILLGSGTALLLGFFGTFIYKNSTLTNLAPFSALIISFIFMLMAKEKQNR